ncbi:MAG: helix-turn-helix domain-containing protein [Lachnospiraceae bacterium]
MQNEFEVIEHPHMKYLNIFIVDMNYRAPHIHRDLEINFLLEGAVRIQTVKEECYIRQGEIAVFHAGQSHELHAVTDTAQILCVQISPRFCRAYYPSITNIQFASMEVLPHLSQESFQQLLALLIETACQYYHRQPAFEFSCMALLNCILKLLLCEMPTYELTEGEQAANRKKTERLNEILNYVEEHYTEKLLLSEIAAQQGVSMPYLSHFIKDNLNQTFQEYVNNLRFIHAKDLMPNDTLSLLDICIESGFSDYRFLKKAFWNHCNCTPQEYRNRLLPTLPIAKKSPSSSLEGFCTPQETLRILNKLKAVHQDTRLLASATLFK